MYELRYDPRICQSCPTVDCLVRCQYMDFDRAAARAEKDKLLAGEMSRVLTDCVTCYGCEEYCPSGNHPFYQIVERQEALGVLPAPVPITRQQLVMMGERGDAQPHPVQPPVIHMCAFPMLVGTIRGPLYEGASTIVGHDLFCNVMWLHFAKNSVIRERLPRVIERIWNFYLKESGIEEVVCYHDECYATFTQIAPAFGIDVPFRAVHLFEYLVKRLDALADRVHSLKARVAYQRPCSNRLVPHIDKQVDEIFGRIGVERVARRYDRDTPLCCGGVMYAHQRDELGDDVQRRNLDDMVAAGAQYCVFNCPACMLSLGEAVAARGIFPIFMSDLCQEAVKP